MAPDPIRGFDHVSVPMQNTDAMIAFYRALGMSVAREGARRIAATSVYVRDPDQNLLEFMIYPAGSDDAGDRHGG
jgi:catechol 2,3-dioxygenase-like lactoylglutathione lyase family enzyme